jgi:hypothetical protein
LETPKEKKINKGKNSVSGILDFKKIQEENEDISWIGNGR